MYINDIDMPPSVTEKNESEKNCGDLMSTGRPLLMRIKIQLIS